MERGRLWVHDKALDVLEDDKVNRKIEALRLNENGSSKFMEQERFKRLPNLRFLHLTEVDFVGDFKNSKLRWLKWERCGDSFEAMNVHLDKLLILDLSGGFISKNWKGWSSIGMERFPNLSELKSLLELELLQCYGLKKLDGLEALQSLRKLDVSTSTELSNLDDFEDLESLRYLDLQSYDGKFPSNCKYSSWVIVCQKAAAERNWKFTPATKARTSNYNCNLKNYEEYLHDSSTMEIKLWRSSVFPSNVNREGASL
ncbi:hypothetical protein NL676_036556 [Syzygium grande]|nr:hypothetical protein NL676_036556 [Syzygium grande]